MRVIAACALVASSASIAQADVGAWIETQRQQWSVPGVAAAVVHDGTTRTYASGLCDVERKRACTPDSEFHLASHTKFFTGLLAATLAVQEIVSLDEPLQRAWPEFRLSDPRWTEVTLRDLLSQRSGLGSVEWPYYWDASLTRKDYLARLPFVPMAQPFRARWAYANANYVAAATYLERKTGASWEELVRKRLLDPLAMKHSGFTAPKRTQGYGFDAAGAPQALPPTRTMASAPAGALVSTANDYAKFLQMVLDEGRVQGRQIVPARAVRIATSPTVGIGFDRRFYAGPGGYAFGLYTASYRGRTILHHPGGYAGYVAHVAFVPDAKLAVAVLCNRNTTSFGEALALGLIDLALGHAPDENLSTWKSAELPPESASIAESPRPPTREWGEYAGHYSHPAWGRFDVIVAAKGLRIRLGRLDAPLDHYRRDSFSFESAPGWERLRLRFEDNFDGEVDGLMLDDGVNPQPMRFARDGPRRAK
jgi:CubicO group peptidase (beta-lactamase class C family)